jgi:hypothetical protein
VPVAAAGQAEVGAADAQPVVALRGGEHVVEQLTGGLLELLALDQRPAGVGDAAGERVAALLQLTEVEHPRRTRGGDPVRHVDPAEALGHQPGELQLEPADLPAQLGPRGPLVDADSLKHPRHREILSRLEGRGGNP